MTPSQKAHFRDHGYLLLPGMLRANVRPLRDHVFDELRRLRIWASGKRLSSTLKDVPAFQQVGKLGQLIRCPDLLGAIVTRDVRSVVDAASETRLTSPKDAQLLVSLPNQGEWSLSNLSWHVDASSPDPQRMPGIQVFALVDDVRPQGGGTLALASSHLVTNEEAVKNVRAAARSGDDITEALRGTALSVVEMSGRAGDVYLMDMRVLHSPAINATKNVRVMATARFMAS